VSYQNDFVPTISFTDMCRVRRVDTYMTQNPELRESLDSIDHLPSHIRSAFIPKEHAVDIGCDIGPRLIGTRIGLVNEITGEIRECTVQDYGTSYLCGEWVEIAFDDGSDMRVSPKELNEMLANPVS
jgi:hypothetical protein